jgi:hypothetical protein
VFHKIERSARTRFVRDVLLEEQLDAAGVVLHVDNGGPMKGASMIVILERPAVFPSFSPADQHVNPVSESLLRTQMTSPSTRASLSRLRAARLNSCIREGAQRRSPAQRFQFVTPVDPHEGRDSAIVTGPKAALWQGETPAFLIGGTVRLAIGSKQQTYSWNQCGRVRELS